LQAHTGQFCLTLRARWPKLCSRGFERVRIGMTSEPTVWRHRRRIDKVYARLRGLDLRDLFGAILAVAGTVIAVTQFTHLTRAAEIAVIVVETTVITSVFVILPPKDERTKRQHKSIKTAEKVALFTVVVIAVLVWIGAVRFFTVGDSVPVRTFDPFAATVGNIQPYLHVKTVTGSCWERSLSDPWRDDTWRCISDRFIYDPCFNYSSAYVLCAADPWATQVTRMDLTSPLNYRLNELRKSGPPFWAMTLATGVECVLLPGANGVVAGQRVNYSCQDGYTVTSVDASSGTAQVQSPDTSTFGTVGILVAWN
jgi:hypothetical protein